MISLVRELPLSEIFNIARSVDPNRHAAEDEDGDLPELQQRVEVPLKLSFAW